MRRLKRVLLALGLLFVLSPSLAYAQNINEQVCRDNPSATFCQENSDTGNQSPGDNRIYGPNGIITKAIRLLSFAIGIAAVVMIIIGGIKYILSSGDPNNVNSAKNTILYALIGLIVAVMAQVIIIFVISKI